LDKVSSNLPTELTVHCYIYDRASTCSSVVIMSEQQASQKFHRNFEMSLELVVRRSLSFLRICFRGSCTICRLCWPALVRDVELLLEKYF